MAEREKVEKEMAAKNAELEKLMKEIEAEEKAQRKAGVKVSDSDEDDDDESSDDHVIIEKVGKNMKGKAGKSKGPPKDQEVLEQNEYQKAKGKAAKKGKGEPQLPVDEEPLDDSKVQPSKGNYITKKLAPKKTLRSNDAMGDWEVVDKRDKFLVEKPIDSSDEGSELSYDD